MLHTTPKTQILITDVPAQDFACGWPQQLQSQLFDREFPQLKHSCLYYTPLAFLHRVVLIFDQEPATLQVHEFLTRALAGKPVKIFLTESLLAKPRAKSFDAAPDHVPDFDVEPRAKPQLSLDTHSSPANSPSLSPDRSDPHSPTALKSLEDGKVHLYQEPLPAPDAPGDDASPRGETKLLYKPRLSLDTRSSGASHSSFSVPMSPSITLNEFPQ
ncbi:Regulator of calcineurin 2 [Lachancea thermotolerans]